MNTLCLHTNVPAYRNAFRLLADSLGLTESPDGFPLTVSEGSGLSLRLTETAGELCCDSLSTFCRGLSYLRQPRPLTVSEQPCFSTLAAMMDCSRNGVPTVEGLKAFLRRISLMGFNALLLYTEDTYAVKEYPYFGYCRGRYSFEELRQLDDYAAALGIEMIPCIQTLGHLSRALRWPGYGNVSDTGDTLLVDSEDTYRMLENLIIAASAPFRSRRIHIGMDEAYSLGRGRHLDQYGYEDPEQLMQRHLQRVHEIVKKHGLHAMMWSDLYFHLASQSKAGSYPRDCRFTPEMIAAIPSDMDLVYWDYYTEDPAYHRQILSQHRQFAADTVFAGGIFTWLSPAPDLQKSERVGRIVLDACKETGVKQVMATLWGDDGAEGVLPYTSLYGLQCYAEYCYGGSWPTAEALDARLPACTGFAAADWRMMDRLNQLPGLTPGKDDTVNPSRQLLYEDPLIPLFERDFEGMELADWYRSLAGDCRRAAERSPVNTLPFGFYADYAEALAAKCALREKAASAVRSRSREAVEALLPLAEEAEKRVQVLADSWQRLWMSAFKPQGWEIIDIRLGGQLQRLRSARARFAAFAAGELSDIPELTEPKLPWLRREDGTFGQLNSWSSIISACPI